MNSKAIRKQLLAAVAMVLVAAVALGSSTYAWFVNNSTVQATGMSVKATAEGGIEIKTVSSTAALGQGYTNGWSTIADAKIASTVLYPASTNPTAANGVITSDWYHASADLATGYAATGNTYAKLQTITDTCTFVNGVASGNGVLSYEDGKTGSVSGGRYYLATTYHIAAVGKDTDSTASATNLKVQGVTVSGVAETDTAGTKTFDKSLRVAVAIGNNVAIYAPVGYTTNATYKVATATTGTPVTLAAATMPDSNNVTALPSTQESNVLSATVGTESAPTVVNVYVWYEGEDPNHYTNAVSGKTIDGLSVTVDFVATLS